MAVRKLAPFLMAVLFFMFARAVGMAVLPLYLESLGLSVIDIGITFAAFGVSLLVFEIIWGFVVDRGRHELLLPVMVVIAVLTFLAFPALRTFEGALLLQVVLGLFLAGVGVVTRRQLFDLSEPSERGRAFGLLGAVFGLSVVAGALFDGWFAALTGYETYFYLAAVLSAFSLVPFLVIIARGKRGASLQEKQPELLPQLLPLKHLLVQGCVAVSIFASWGFFSSLMPIIITKPPVGATPPQAIISLAVFSASTMIFQPVMGEYGSRRPWLWITGGLATNTLAFLALGAAASLPAVYALTFVAGACYAAVSPVSVFEVVTKIPERFQGRVLGLYGAAEDVGFIIGPSLGSVAWETGGPGLTYTSMGAVVAASLVVFVGARRTARTPLVSSPLSTKG